MKIKLDCLFCDHKFETTAYYIKHLTDSHLYTLDSVGKKIAERKIAELSTITHNCEYCQKEFPSVSNLNRHLSKSCKNKPIAPETNATEPVPTKGLNQTPAKVPAKFLNQTPTKPINKLLEPVTEISDNQPEPETPLEIAQIIPEATEATEEKPMVIFTSKLVDPETIAYQGHDPKYKVMYDPYNKSLPPVEAYPLFTQHEVNGVHILVQKDDLLNFLNHKCGGPPEAYRFIQGTIYRGPEGDADMFEKVYMDGKSPDKYPMKILNERENRFSYVNEKGEDVFRGAYRHIKGAIRGNILDCYLVVQNACIYAKIDGTKSLYDHDYADWQNRIYEYTKEKRKEQMMKAIVNRIKLRTKEYYGNG